MRRWFRRRAQESGPDEIAWERDATGRFTADSLRRIRRAAEAGHVVSMANLGVALYQEGDRAGALRWWSRAWEAGNAGAGFNLGTLFTASGDTNRAQVVWERAAALGDPDAMLGLVGQGLERGDQDTVDRWSPLILAQDAAFPVTALGMAFQTHGREAEAVRAYLRAEELGDAYAMEYRARILESHGAHEEAEALRERAKTAERMM
ncbi:hypothetical protein AB0N17_25210 [Streptomyces sp. NPDC051133]|uniref:hypothetical protein n=1 Tax=Streptomyces sp. NPDC051133 TaxID=3155521 RepID=UPI0034422DD2